ncbi:MAG: hypothetical protein KME31_22085, partial [Tolypothrix carrinoi HA7290-LM1]|nr:hypothetical protein [Tolypothrix carrinoi HA7290-LM1]
GWNFTITKTELSRFIHRVYSVIFLAAHPWIKSISSERIALYRCCQTLRDYQVLRERCLSTSPSGWCSRSWGKPRQVRDCRRSRPTHCLPKTALLHRCASTPALVLKENNLQLTWKLFTN